MVQKEIKKKTRLYGLAAVLSAIILVSMIYFVASPVSISLGNVSPLMTFKSADELKTYINTNTKAGSNYFGGGPLDESAFSARSGVSPTDGMPRVPAAVPAGSAGLGAQGFGTNGESDTSAPSYSTTNVQVAGVDEADSVKTDGSYLYTTSQGNVYIVNADPQDPEVVSKISVDTSSYIAGLFLSQDGSKLVVIGSQYGGLIYPIGGLAYVPYMNFVQEAKTFVNVYDVTNKASPLLARNFTISGSYFNSRLIGNDLYVVVSQQATVQNNSVNLPEFSDQNSPRTIEPNQIHYTNIVDTYFTYTTFVSVDITDNSADPSSMTILMGSASNMYVSQSNMYVTFPSQDGLGTDIYRVKINGLTLTAEAQGEAPGYVLNQYSMDEYNGNFRLATTVSSGTWLSKDQQNSLYVLNSDLTIIGKIENLGVGERIYSARFAGDKCYLVTFKQMDPFFVVDLSNPQAPRVAGELKIPGYSSYLHPYDENHVIGIGKENGTMKLSLFDVTDMSNPVETSHFTVDAGYADSEALNDPKAFLFDLQKQLLVIPVSTSGYITPQPMPLKEGGTSTSTTPTYGGSWNGVYVFNVNAADGFALKGTVTQIANSTSGTDYYNMYNYYVHRAVFIGNTLYTVSDLMVQLNNLDTLTLTAQVNLQ
jgi:inhibitor of cysteine peptidase